MLENLSNLLALLVALSLASEKLVAIVKSLVPWLSKEQPTTDYWRKLVLQLLAVLMGVATAFLAKEVLPPPLQGHAPLVLLGLLASGGSGFWTSVLGYVGSVRDIKKTNAVENRVRVAHAVATVAREAAHPAVVREPAELREPAAAALAAAQPSATEAPLASNALQRKANENLAKAIALANATL